MLTDIHCAIVNVYKERNTDIKYVTFNVYKEKFRNKLFYFECLQQDLNRFKLCYLGDTDEINIKILHLVLFTI